VYATHCLDVDVTTADASIAAGDVFALRHRLEGLNAASFGFGHSGTRSVTLSFWVKSTKTGTFCISLTNSASDRCYIAEYTVSVSNTWEKKTLTIPVDTTGTWLYDTGIGLQVAFVLAAGATYQGVAGWQGGSFAWATSNQVNALDSTANNFKIALVQLEAGSVATPFETRPYGTELALCQRYYEKSFPMATAPATNTASGSAVIVPQIAGASAGVRPACLLFKVAKRAPPSTTTCYNPNAANNQMRNSTIGADWSATSFSATENYIYTYGVSPAASASTNDCIFHWTADSEL
jgi:hypothetical protein